MKKKQIEVTAIYDDVNSDSVILSKATYQMTGSWIYYFLEEGAREVKIIDLDCIAN